VTGDDYPLQTGTNRRISRTLARTLVVVVIGSIMASPSAGDGIRTSLATMQQLATGYTLALYAVIPLATWTMRRFGVKRARLAALSLFTGGSAASHPGRCPV